MGNAQSAPTVPHHRRNPSNRLSKPLTNYSSPKLPGGHSRLNSTFDIETRNSTSRIDQPEQADGPLKPPSSKILSSLPTSAVDTNDDAEEKEPNPMENDSFRFKTGVNEIKRRFSRSRPTSNSLRLPRESRTSPTPAMENNEKSTFGDWQNAKRVIGLGLRKSDDIISMSTRQMPSMCRRSLNTPGLATRYPRDSPYQDANGMYDSPPQIYRCQCGRDAPAPTLSPQAGSGQYFGAGDEIRRAVSPNELEYSHLGRLKFGSLRVVNGTASPTPSSKRQSSCPDLAARRKDELGVHSHDSQLTLGDLQCESRSQRTFYNHDTCSGGQVHDPEATLQGQTTAHPCSRPTSSSWFVDAASPPPDLAYDSRSATPVSLERTPALSSPSQADGAEDEHFEDEGVGFSSPRAAAKRAAKSNVGHKNPQDQVTGHENAYSLNKSDSGYSSVSARSGQRQTFKGNSTTAAVEGGSGSIARRNTVGSESLYRVRNYKADPGSFIACGGGLPDPEEHSPQPENKIEIKSHGTKEFNDLGVFQWPPPRSSSLVDECLEQFRQGENEPCGTTAASNVVDEYAANYDSFRNQSRPGSPLQATLPLIYEQASNESYPGDRNLESVLAAAEADPSPNVKSKPTTFGRTFSGLNRRYLSRSRDSTTNQVSRTRSMMNIKAKKASDIPDPTKAQDGATNAETSPDLETRKSRNRLRRKPSVVEPELSKPLPPLPHEAADHKASGQNPSRRSYRLGQSHHGSSKPLPTPNDTPITRPSDSKGQKKRQSTNPKPHRSLRDSKNSSNWMNVNLTRGLTQTA